MALLNQAFKYADQPKIEQSPAKGFSKEGAFLVFKGSEALILAQFCQGQSQPPCLIAECPRGENRGPHLYEGLKFYAFAHSYDASGNLDGRVQASTNLGSLYFDVNKQSDPDGLCITKLETLPEFFPMQDYKVFRAELLGQKRTSPKIPEVN